MVQHFPSGERKQNLCSGSFDNDRIFCSNWIPNAQIAHIAIFYRNWCMAYLGEGGVQWEESGKLRKSYFKKEKKNPTN